MADKIRYRRRSNERYGRPFTHELLFCRLLGLRILYGIHYKKGVRPITLLVVYTLISTLAIGGLYYYPSAALAPILSAVVGFSAAGGVMQLGLVMMTEMFPKGKGTMTGIFYTTGSIASFTIPVITGRMADSGINSIMGLDAGIALAGFIVACIIYVRYNSVIKVKKQFKLKYGGFNHDYNR